MTFTQDAVLAAEQPFTWPKPYKLQSHPTGFYSWNRVAGGGVVKEKVSLCGWYFATGWAKWPKLLFYFIKPVIWEADVYEERKLPECQFSLRHFQNWDVCALPTGCNKPPGKSFTNDRPGSEILGAVCGFPANLLWNLHIPAKEHAAVRIPIYEGLMS